MASRRRSDKPWYMDKKFDRFWEHYHSCYAWMNMHHQSVSKSTSDNPAEVWRKWSEYATQMYYFHQNQQMASPVVNVNLPAFEHNRVPSHCSSDRNSKRKSTSRPSSRHSRRAKKRRERKRVDSVVTSQSEMDTMDVDEDLVCEDEDLLCDIPYSDDLLKFLTQSAKHRKQRDEQKRLAEEKEKENNYGEDFDRTYQATTKAPKERPGQRRTAEMKILYGKGAAMIHGMETAMQLTFDRNCDLKQPKHWPNLPLDIKFH